MSLLTLRCNEFVLVVNLCYGGWVQHYALYCVITYFIKLCFSFVYIYKKILLYYYLLDEILYNVCMLFTKP